MPSLQPWQQQQQLAAAAVAVAVVAAAAAVALAALVWPRRLPHRRRPTTMAAAQ